MSDTRQHSVWNVYDEIRTARLNVKCLQVECGKINRRHAFIEITIALASTSSIGGFWFLQNMLGGYLWKSVGALAITLTAVKPVLKLNEKVRENQHLLAGYHTLEHDLNCIRIEVQQRQKYDAELHKEFMKILKRKGDLITKHDGTPLSKKSQRECENEVDAEMPLDSFYIPSL